MKYFSDFDIVNYVDIEIVRSEPALDRMLEHLDMCDSVAFDTETSGFYFWEHHIIGYCLCGSRDKAFYIPVRHRNPSDLVQLDPFIMVEVIEWLFKEKRIVCHNAKFDLLFAKAEGIRNFPSRLEDTFFQSMLINEVGGHKLIEHLGKKYIGDFVLQPTKALEAAKRSRVKELKIRLDKLTYADIPIGILGVYGATDVWTTWVLDDEHFSYEKEFSQQVYLNEIALIPAMMDRQWRGVTVDVEYLERLKEEYTQRTQGSLEVLQRLVFEATGEEGFNPNSPQQVVKYFKAVGIDTGAKTASGAMSVDEDSLLGLSGSSEFVNTQLKYRSDAKVLSTYITGILERGSILHPNYNQFGTVTGRSSSNDPNCQNFPAGPLIRNAFIVPNSDFYIFTFDYSQIELRVLADYSKDSAMVRTYNEGGDIHILTASFILDKMIEDVTGDERKKAKPVNFGIVYGIGPNGLIKQARKNYGVIFTQQETQEYITKYLNRYTGVAEWINKTKYLITRDQCLENRFGRVRHFSRDLAMARGDTGKLNAIARQGVNFPIQSTAADVMKFSMRKVFEFLIKNKCLSRLILDVHDEFVMYIHKNELDIVPQIIDIMEDWKHMFEIDIIVDVKYGESYGSVQPL